MTNKKIKTANCLCLALSALALIFECMPKSLLLADLISPGEYKISYANYFSSPSQWLNWSALIAIIIAFLTILSLVVNIIVVIKDGKLQSVLAIIPSSLILLASIIYAIASARFLSAYNILVLILYVVSVILQGIKFKWSSEKFLKKV